MYRMIDDNMDLKERLPVLHEHVFHVQSFFRQLLLKRRLEQKQIRSVRIEREKKMDACIRLTHHLEHR